jgi:hypothetical protein
MTSWGVVSKLQIEELANQKQDQNVSSSFAIAVPIECSAAPSLASTHGRASAFGQFTLEGAVTGGTRTLRSTTTIAMSARATTLRRLQGLVASTSGTHPRGHAAARSVLLASVASSGRHVLVSCGVSSADHPGAFAVRRDTRWNETANRQGAGFRGYAAAGDGGDGTTWDDAAEGSADDVVLETAEESTSSGDSGNDAALPYVGSASAGDLLSVDPTVLPSDDVLPPHLMRPSWLQKKRTRKQKGSYEGFLTEIDSYPDFEPPGGALYNISDFAHKTVESDAGLLKQFTSSYIDEQRKIYENRGGTAGLSDEDFIERYNESFAKTDTETAGEIITWEVVMVHEAGGENDHPLNRKVVMKVGGKDLQKETGISDEALAYVVDICGSRYDAKKDVLKIVCSRSRNREHNRQWCLKVLYDLIMEGNREFPSDSYSFSPEGPVEPQGK